MGTLPVLVAVLDNGTAMWPELTVRQAKRRLRLRRSVLLAQAYPKWHSISAADRTLLLRHFQLANWG